MERLNAKTLAGNTLSICTPGWRLMLVRVSAVFDEESRDFRIWQYITDRFPIVAIVSRLADGKSVDGFLYCDGRGIVSTVDERPYGACEIVTFDGSDAENEKQISEAVERLKRESINYVAEGDLQDAAESLRRLANQLTLEDVV